MQGTYLITLFIVGITVFELITAVEVEEPVKDIKIKCMTDTGVTPAEVKLVEAADFIKMKKPTQQLQCYMKCMLDHTELLEEGKIKETTLQTKFAKKITKAELDKAITACTHFKGKNHCEAAYNLAKCYADNKVNLF